MRFPATGQESDRHGHTIRGDRLIRGCFDIQIAHTDETLGDEVCLSRTGSSRVRNENTDRTDSQIRCTAKHFRQDRFLGIGQHTQIANHRGVTPRSDESRIDRGCALDACRELGIVVDVGVATCAGNTQSVGQRGGHGFAGVIIGARGLHEDVATGSRDCRGINEGLRYVVVGDFRDRNS